MLTYPAHFHYPIIPEVGLSANGIIRSKKQTLKATLYLQIKASFRGQNRALWRQRSGKCMLEYVTSDVDLDLNDGDMVRRP